MQQENKTDNTAQKEQIDKIMGDGSMISESKDAIRQAVGEMYSKVGISEYPSCMGPEGIMYDFCWGLRIYVPDAPQREYHIQFWDMEDEKLSFDGVMNKSGWVQSTKHYYRPYFIRISDNKTGDVIFEHKMSLESQNVLMYFPIDTIGDTLAWFKAVEEFQKLHKCRIFVAVADYIRPLLEKAHPDMRFISREQCRTIHPYASYMFGVSYDDDFSCKRSDFRTVPLHWRGADILGMDAHPWQDEPPLIDFDRESPSPFEEHYVTIASMASGGCKLWLNPNGWGKVIKFLKHYGYRIIDIDGRLGTSNGFMTQYIPRDAEDFTGTGEGCSLRDRARQIYHSDFFIGLGSGLSWLAWCVRKPVVLISGFSEPWCEFYTPYRVINQKVCHGCFNDVRYTFDQHDCFWCPKYKGTNRQLECSTQITPEQVIRMIQRIPEFQERARQIREQKETRGEKANEVKADKKDVQVWQVRNNEIVKTDKAPQLCWSTEKEATLSIRPGMPNEVKADKKDVQVWQVRNNEIVKTDKAPSVQGKCTGAEKEATLSIRPGMPGASAMLEQIQRRINNAAAKKAENGKVDTLSKNSGKKKNGSQTKKETK